MVHSKGTRSESHLFRIDRTGRAKYSGRSRELLRHSAVRFGVLLLPGHSSGASPGTPLFGLCSGRIGKRLSELGTARRRRPENPGDGRGEKREERTGDIAHLVLVQYFAFSSLLSSY